MFKTIKNFIHTKHNSTHLHCIWTGASGSLDNDPTLKNCLFGAITLNKNVDIDKYGYSSYGTGFDRKSSFNLLIFGVDMSFSAHTDNKRKTYQFLEKDQRKD